MRASAPGKIILFGEHAVVYGQPAIAVPVNEVHADVSISPSARNGIWMKAPAVGLSGELEALPPSQPVAQLIRTVLAEWNIQSPPNLEILIESTVPVAAGMGSGAAVSVALIRALAGSLGHSANDEEVNRLAFEAERLHHATPSGIDNTVITYGRAVYYMKGQPLAPLKVARPITLVIGDTGVGASTKEAVTDVRRQRDAEPAKWDVLFAQAGDIARSARENLASGEWQKLGPLMNQNHALLVQMTVSSPELDRLVQAARDAGALGAKMSGGGRGGNMIALVSGSAARVADALSNSGARRVITTTVPATR